MDSSLLRMLQAMKRVEDDPACRGFKAKTIDMLTFTPKYPNVMIIDQRETRVSDRRRYIPSQPRSFTSCASGPVKNEFVSNSICRGLSSIFVPLSPLSSMGGGWTVVIKEGLYINPLMGLISIPMTPLLTRFQVVGVEDVRILFTKFFHYENCPPMTVTSIYLDLENVRIYDFRSNNGNVNLSTILAGGPGETRVSLANVTVHTPDNMAFRASGSGTSVSFNECAMHGCQIAISVEDGVEIHMENSSVSEESKFALLVDRKSKFTAIKSRFVNHYRFDVQRQSQCVIDRCQFERDPGIPDHGSLGPMNNESIGVALRVFSECKITCERSSFRGFRKVVNLEGSDCQAFVRGCDITVTDAVADVLQNAGLIATDNDIDSSSSLLRIGANIKGKVSFLRNRLSPSTPRVITIDKMSKKPKHDIDGVTFQPIVVSVNAKTSRERSKYTKSVNALVQEMGDRCDITQHLDYHKYKRCGKCLKYENEEALQKWISGKQAAATEKFRYCDGCQLAAYCSKECQVAHWPDHRLLCKGRIKVKL